MKFHIQQTSLMAYKEFKDSGKLSEQQEVVYNWFLCYPCSTDKEIENLSKIPINMITARRNELVKIGLLECKGKRECMVTHKTAMMWEKTGK